MPDLKDNQIRDLMIGTLNELGRGKFSQIAQELIDYEVMGQLLKKDKVIFTGGKGIRRTLMVRTGDTFRHVGLHAQDRVNIADLLEEIEVAWVHATSYWGWERRELLENTGKALITNVIKPRRAGAIIDIAQGMEETFFDAPDADDDSLPWGLQYWVVKNSSTGFYGGNPSGFSDCGGVDASTITKWRNYTTTYSDITDVDDFLSKLLTAVHYTNFKSPVKTPDYRRGVDRRFYTNWTVRQALWKLVRATNENLGPDLAAMEGEMVFKKMPIRAPHYLDNDTSNPFYGVDFGVFYPVFLKGDYMRESEPDTVSGQHNSWVIFVDNTYNYLCTNRRANFVMYAV